MFALSRGRVYTFFNIISIGVAIFGVRVSVRFFCTRVLKPLTTFFSSGNGPILLLPQLILSVIRIGVLVALLCALICVDVVATESALLYTAIAFIMTVYSGYKIQNQQQNAHLILHSV